MLSKEARHEIEAMRAELDRHLQTIYKPSDMGSDQWNVDQRIAVLKACNTILAFIPTTADPPLPKPEPWVLKKDRSNTLWH